MARKRTPIDAYLQAVRGPRRKALEEIRKAIHGLHPDVEECISYRMPAFRVKGQVVAGFRVTSSGCSYYPFSGRTLKTVAADIEGYSRTLSALHFDAERPLPRALVKKLLAARVAEIQQRKR